MSKVTKRKHVMKEIQADDFDSPEPNQQIVRILGSRGNNLHEVESAEPIAGNGNECTDATTTNDGMPETSSEQFLVSMPTKFRKNVWVKRGDFVIVEPIDEGDKVKAEIVRILTPQHIKEFTKNGIWPKKFTTKNNNETKNDNPDDSSDNDDDLFKNTNRAHQYIDSEEEEEDESEDDDESDEESDGNESDEEESSSDKGN